MLYLKSGGGVVNIILSTFSQRISQDLPSGNMLKHTVRSNKDKKIESEETVWGQKYYLITFSIILDWGHRLLKCLRLDQGHKWQKKL